MVQFESNLEAKVSIKGYRRTGEFCCLLVAIDCHEPGQLFNVICDRKILLEDRNLMNF